MPVSKAIAVVSLLLLTSWNSSKAQTSSDTTQVDELKSLVMSQQKTLEHQPAQIEALQNALAEQKEMLASALQKNGSANNTAIVSAVYHPFAETSIATKPQAPQNPP